MFKNEVLPQYEEFYGNNHPFTVHVRSRIGLCLNDIKPGNIYLVFCSSFRLTHDSSLALSIGVGSPMIDASLNFFETYEQIAFASNHPWILDLGGYGSFTPG